MSLSEPDSVHFIRLKDRTFFLAMPVIAKKKKKKKKNHKNKQKKKKKTMEVYIKKKKKIELNWTIFSM